GQARRNGRGNRPMRRWQAPGSRKRQAEAQPHRRARGCCPPRPSRQRPEPQAERPELSGQARAQEPLPGERWPEAVAWPRPLLLRVAEPVELLPSLLRAREPVAWRPLRPQALEPVWLAQGLALPGSGGFGVL